MSRWNYLSSSSFLVRQIIAAHYLKDLPIIIEIGGWKNPIRSFLTHPYEQTINIDPLIENREEEKIFDYQEDYRNFEFGPYIRKSYGLVCLGFELPCSLKLIHLCNKAEKLIIEYPSNHDPSIDQFELLRPYLKLKLDLHLKLDLRGNHFEDIKYSFPVFPYRTLHIFSSRSSS